MRYVSTRGTAPVLGFEDVLLTGLARDGGLYVPETWPQLTVDEIRAFAGRPYEEVAYEVMRPFVGDEVPGDAFKSIIDEAYATFSHRAVAPLVQLGAADWLLELFHGPTLAFKDVAMQVLARLMDGALARRGARATIVCATSGDTGGAAVEAFRGRDSIDIVVLHPHGRVSDVQRRQMTTAQEDNVHNIAIEGTFDDCQALVKALFNTSEVREKLALSGVNSINWARIMAQTVYYFTAAVALGAPERRVSFCVPTGNFGDILAGYVAKRMGLGVERLVIASNVNDILARVLETGRYELDTVAATMSPSMDIQVSSNFERLLFEAHGRDGGAVIRLMDGLKQSGSFTLEPPALAAIRRDFEAERSNEVETAEMMRQTFTRSGYIADPHTAVGLRVAARKRGDRATPMVVLATAHPAKFPEAVKECTGEMPKLPKRVSNLYECEERIDVLANDFDTVRRFIEDRSRAARAPV